MTSALQAVGRWWAHSVEPMAKGDWPWVVTGVVFILVLWLIQSRDT